MAGPRRSSRIASKMKRNETAPTVAVPPPKRGLSDVDEGDEEGGNDGDEAAKKPAKKKGKKGKAPARKKPNARPPRRKRGKRDSDTNASNEDRPSGQARSGAVNPPDINDPNVSREQGPNEGNEASEDQPDGYSSGQDLIGNNLNVAQTMGDDQEAGFDGVGSVQAANDIVVQDEVDVAQVDAAAEPELAGNAQPANNGILRLRLRTIDPTIAREIGLDATMGTPSNALKAQIRYVAQMKDNTAAKAILKHLLEEYGTGNIWDRSWPVEAYLDQPIDFDGRWDVFEDLSIAIIRKIWQDVYFDVRAKDASVEGITVFTNAYLKAKYLARCGRFVGPMAKDPDTDQASYVRLEYAAVAKRQTQHFREEQLKASDDIEKRFGRDILVEFERQCDEVYEKWIEDETPGDLELDPLLSAFTWTKMTAVFESWSPTPEEQTGFEEIRYLVQEFTVRYQRFVHPPMNLEGLSCEDFLDLMSRFIAGMRTTCEEETLKLWRKTLKMSENALRRDELHKTLVSTYKHTKLGGWPMSHEYIVTQDKAVEAAWKRLEDTMRLDFGTVPAECIALKETNTALCERNVFIEPPSKDATITWPTYVKEILRPLLIARDQPYWLRIWDSEIRTLESLRRPDVTLMKDLRARMIADTSTNQGRLPYGPLAGRFFEAWEEVFRRAKEENVSRITIGRIEDVHARVDKLFQLSGMTLLPTDWPQEVPADDYLLALSRDIISQLSASYNVYWDDMKKFSALKSAGWNALYNRMIHNLSRGQDFYGPPPMIEEYVEDRGSGLAKELDVKDGDRSGLKGRWNFRGTLGAGSYGHVGYWEQIDVNRLIVDRIAVKESYLQNDWNDEPHWDGDKDLRRPREFFFAEYLAGLPGSNNIVKPRTYAIYDTLRMHRIYMEYCEHGSMKGMIKSYLKEDIIAADGSELKSELPIRLLWSAFEAMASALCLMQNGSLPDIPLEGEAVYPGIIHRDLKPDNIFMTPPSSESWDSIPVFKIGDFGLAIQKADLADTNVSLAGTPGFMPPERSVRLEGDIWTVGKIMLDLLNRQGGYREEDARHDLNREVLEDGNDNRYPAAMRELVRECLQSEAGDRPSCESLWRSIQDEVAVGTGPDGRSLRSMKTDAADGELILIQRGLYDKFI